MTSVRPCIAFIDNAEDAVSFYVGLFQGGAVAESMNLALLGMSKLDLAAFREAAGSGGHAATARGS